MRALLLARKSNKVQINAAERGDGLSLETQEGSGRRLAARCGTCRCDGAANGRPAGAWRASA